MVNMNALFVNFQHDSFVAALEVVVHVSRIKGRTLHVAPVIHNSLNNQLEPLQQERKHINWYACGPTVYDDAHLGHARTYICFDVIRRILTSHFNISLHYAMGVTDIDDKIINRAKLKNVLPQQIATQYEERFFEDMSALGVLEPHARLRVSENVDNIIAYIQTIIANGHAYITDSGVYFDVNEFGEDNYGSFRHQFSEDNRESDGSFTTDKRDRRDFALWKCSPDAELSEGGCWESPWGIGRPGWHIECSALTHAHFGPHLNIHSGGRDLAFPHHCNEIAQCESHRGEPGQGWGDLWMHTGHLYIKGRKMSKSLKNFISVRELLEGVHHDDLRMYCLQYHYRADVHFSQDRIQEAASIRGSFSRFVERASALGVSNGGWGASERKLFDKICVAKTRIEGYLGTDFDTPSVIRELRDLVQTADAYIMEKEGAGRVPTEPIASVSRLLVETLTLFGISSVTDRASSSPSGHTEVMTKELVNFRSTVREAAKRSLKDKSNIGSELLGVCDDLRDRVLPAMGIYLEDRPSGTLISSVPKTKTK